MTREEAKIILEAYIACESKKAHFECDDFNCDDNCPLLYDMGTVGEYNEAINMAIQALEQEPKTGHWIVNKKCGSIYCSKCGCGALYDKVYPGESVFGKTIRVKSTFCPTCGLRMVEPQESEGVRNENF